MPLTIHTDITKFIHTDINGDLYEVQITYDGAGRARAYPSGGVYPDMTYSLPEVTFTVAPGALEEWRTVPLSVKKAVPVYNGMYTIEQVLNPI